MEKDHRFWYTLIDCVNCGMESHGIEIFYNDEGTDVVIILCDACVKAYGQRELTSAEKKQNWIN